MPEELTERIEVVAEGPASVSVDGQSVSQQSLSELISADKHLAQKQAAARPHHGMRFTKIVPPSARGGDPGC